MSKREQPYSIQKGQCFYCLVQIRSVRDMEIDHVLPNSKGGRDADCNVVGYCGACNDLKGNIASRAEAEGYMARLRQFWKRNGEQIEAIVADKQYLFRQRKKRGLAPS